MVVHFKVLARQKAVHKITRTNAESFLGRDAPWFQPGQHRGDDKYYAVCPYCNTPIQLKALYKRTSDSPQPYGSHTGKPVEGFSFSEPDLEFCPYRRKKRRFSKDIRREMSKMSRQLIHLAVTEFDRIVLILRDDFGFRFSNKFALRMLEQWFDSQAYRYEGAHLRNLPWMIAYFGPVQDLFGQPVKDNEELCTVITETVPGVNISESGRLEKGQNWYQLKLQCLWHKLVLDEESSDIHEQLLLRIKDYTNTNVPEHATTIYEKVIVFNPERFEALMRVPDDRAKRNTVLLEDALILGKKWGYTCA